MNNELKLSPISLFAILFEKPFPYQQDVIMCQSKRITFRSGRQVGKTTLAAIRAIYHVINKENRQVVIISPSQRQSSIMFRKIIGLIKHPMIYNQISRQSQTMIIFKNGSEIHSLPGNNPDTIRGFSPTKAIVDEAAFMKDELFVALEPSLAATNGDLELYSSPFGKRGRFYRAFEEESFIKFHVKSSDSPLVTEEFLESQRNSLTELEYIQEYEGEFLSEQDTYFPRELILSCIGEIEEVIRPNIEKEYFLGVDISRYGLDETVYTICETQRGNARIIFIANTSKKPLTDVIGRVKYLHDIWRFKGIYVDESGLGSGAADSLIQAGLPIKNLNIKIESTNKTYRERGVQFTLQNKEALYKNLKMLMEQGRIKLPDNPKLISQLTQLQYEFTESGHLKLHHPDRGHDDYTDSLALSCISLIKRMHPNIPMPGGTIKRE